MDIPGASHVPAPTPVKSGGKGSSGGKGGGPRLSGQAWASEAHANAMAQDSLYAHSVANVFHAQSRSQQKAILKGAAANPHSRAAQVLHGLLGATAFTEHGLAPPKFQGVGPDHLKPWTPAGIKYAVEHPAPAFPKEGGGGGILGWLGGAAGTVEHAVGNALHANANTSSDPVAQAFGPPKHPGGIIGAATAPGAAEINAPMFQGPKNAPAFLENTGKDAIDLPAETLTSIGMVGSDAVKGRWGDALNTMVQPYVQAFKNPAKAFYGHPLDTYLLAASLEHPVTRAAETGVRAVTKSGPVDLSRPSVELTGNLTHERPNAATMPRYRAMQRGLDKARLKATETGGLTPKSANARARLIKIETSRLVGQNERVRRAHLDEQQTAHARQVRMGGPGDRSTVGKRVAGSVSRNAQKGAYNLRNALKYDPRQPLIPGADVLGLIAQGIVRRPDTVAADLSKHLAQVAARRPGLADSAKDLAAHDKYVKTLQDALQNKKFLRNPGPAFRAAAEYEKSYGKLERQARSLGHYRDMGGEELRRRTLMPMVATHMPDVRWDPERGLVQDTEHGVRSISTAEMERFAKEQTGGRRPAYISHQGKPEDSNFYVSGQKRPLPAAQRNTLFSFMHGLTDPSHEAMLKSRAKMQGVIDAHKAMNRLDEHLVVGGKNGESFGTYQDAERAGRELGMVPIRRASAFHPSDSLAKATEGVDMSTIDEEAARRSLNIADRLRPTADPGHWGLIDPVAAAQLRAHEDQISPNTFLRAVKGVNSQFRTVALATSFRHLPGVAQESLIRSAASGVGPVSWLAGRAVLRRSAELDPELAAERHIQMLGGTVSGEALALRTRQVSRHFQGTMLHGPLAAWEKARVAPGLRQASTLWRTWAKFTLGGTKKMLEEQSQIAGIGRATIEEFGGRHGLAAVAMRQWGDMVDKAAHGVLDEQGMRKFNATTQRIYGRWNDLTPGEQQALMFSPFGMWWVNSVKWLARFPVDHPILAGAAAAANVGTEKQRGKLGLDLFAPNALPLYKQGAVVLGGKMWDANYYSPFGVANDPLETAQQLVQPWLSSPVLAALGDNWHGGSLTSPGNPGGYKESNSGERLMVILGSLGASFIPLYQKAETIAEGGGSSYDTSSLLAPQTKGKNPGALKGLEKALMPIRLDSSGSKRSSGGVSLPSVSVPSVSVPSVSVPSISLPG